MSKRVYKSKSIWNIFVIILVIIYAATILASCGNQNGGLDNHGQTAGNGGSGSGSGLTSLEAQKLAWPVASKVFDDTVLWQMAPVDDRESKIIRLGSDWQDSDRSSAWFLWYADAAGENWFMIGIDGKRIVYKDIGTRGSPVSMNNDWPRESTAVSMKEAAEEAASQGANLDSVTWVEFTCDYELSDYQDTPVWAFACSDTVDSGGTLNYTMFVNAITGEVAGAVNDRNEKLDLPIDIESLQETRTDNHEADVREFFSFIEKHDPIWAVRQLSYEASPDEPTAQMWLANFESLTSLKVVSIEQASLEQWTGEWECYKVELDVETNEPVDKYGWENGSNIRWVTIIPQGAGAWKVFSLAQSP